MSERLLIIDDSVIDQSLTRAAVTDFRQKFLVEIESTAREGYERLRTESFDVCIVDYRIGATTALDFIEKSSILVQSLPIIVVTGSVMGPEVGEELIRAGAADFVLKDELFEPVFERIVMHSVIRHRALTQLREEATHDALTGVQNKNYYMRRLDAAVLRSRRVEEPISVLIFDADKLEFVNDRFGHDAGDQVLCRISEIAQSNIRMEDCLGRIAGDEFAIFLQNATKSTAMEIGTRIQTQVEEDDFDYEGNSMTLSVSVGVYSNDGVVEEAEALIRKAREAQLYAKDCGRNCVRYYDDLPTGNRADLEATLQS